MLTLIGTGLCDARDLTLRGMDAIRAAHAVYIEGYTSLLQCSHGELEAALGTSVTRLMREDVERGIGRVLEDARTRDVALLVVGDPLAATTHADLILRARELRVDVRIVHNASVMSAIGAIGLEPYRYGKTVSVPYWQRSFEPTSFLDGIRENRERGLHTLCLLDIKAEEGRFMSVGEGIAHLERAEGALRTGIVTPELLVVGVARLGCPDARIVAGELRAVKEAAFGAPPHCLVVPGRLHHIEEQMLAPWNNH